MKVFVIAGEPSGDRLGAAVMAGLRALVPEVRFDGIGGAAMTAEGLESRFPIDELSVMGLVEVLPRALPLLRRVRETAEAVMAARPDVLLTIDSPDFCLRVAKQLRARQAGGPRTRIVHYVAPSVWAWRPGRAAKMAARVDQVLALLPFEPPLMEAAGVACDFVGHPVVAEPQASPAEAEAFRAELGLEGAPLILALPGSRRGEVARLAGRFGAALGQVVAARPGARVALPAAGPVVEMVRQVTADWPLRPLILDPTLAEAASQKRAAFRAADVALAASGTVSLELAAAGTPMVIAYDVNPLSRVLARMLLRIDTVTLVNLVSDTRAVPEFLGRACRPGPIAEAVLQVLEAPVVQREAMALTMERLGQGGEAPGLRAARAILSRL